MKKDNISFTLNISQEELDVLILALANLIYDLEGEHGNKKETRKTKTK